MTDLTKEYLDDLIKKKVFKEFEKWDKNDFYFLLSLLNYPNYCNLALVILVNLKNWIIYSKGDFFYPLEKLEKILDKYYLNNDIDKEMKKEENIKLNINKKNNDNIDDDFLNIDLDNGYLNFGDYLSIDTFKFFIWVIIFFVLFTLINIFSYSKVSNNNYYNRENFQVPYNLRGSNLESLFSHEKLDNNKNENNFFMNLLDDKYLSKGSLIKNILNKAINYIF